ncbi:hypothetical protein GII36_03300 [Candidatus Mycosynbacter amalyticus]|uniref:Uncharacterized protein n=1 Tax=Candidatus Mycosynbacter amalyticus TaxID=2665156 RepID=A0A857MJY4_9BACT|nr:hypothetical protein [Candidatus Mycosynbacter amalyticus]QHN42866.1 hypothetical protein GII36_03300 [Candidatus Mycosynbacter amalyticus]
MMDPYLKAALQLAGLAAATFVLCELANRRAGVQRPVEFSSPFASIKYSLLDTPGGDV